MHSSDLPEAADASRAAKMKPVLALARSDTVTDFANLVRDVRMQAGLTQNQLAERAGLPVRSPAKFERAEAAEYPLGYALLLLRFLGVRLEPTPAGRRLTLADALAKVPTGWDMERDAR